MNTPLTLSAKDEARLKMLRSAPLGKWIAIFEEESRIVEVGDTYMELSDKLDAAGVEDVVVMKTPPAWNSFFFQYDN